jgi:catechol 2,3-dioxygenase-like lactoylglutathione lyase family enzyme
MLHHISFPVADLGRSAQLYDQALAPLGYWKVCEGEGFVGYGTEAGKDQLLLSAHVDARAASPGFHLALAAPSRAAVDQFHQQALKLGAHCNGPPGLRVHYGPHYYAAFIIDLDGYHLEAVINTLP